MGNTVLVCDDSLLVRSGLESLLKQSGKWSEVFSASNGKEGLEIILAKKPDVVCLDIEMPEMDGIQVLTELNKLRKAGSLGQKPRVIVLSGTMHQNEPNVRKAKMLGAFDVVAKPEGQSSTLKINFQELEARLLTALL
ncbi:MAG: response regulator [Spirochaetales bacterium]|nr:response regulator [Spirochaetales bacterium]